MGWVIDAGGSQQSNEDDKAVLEIEAIRPGGCRNRRKELKTFVW
jgi:hypothetical protein